MVEPKYDQNGDLTEPALLFHEFLFLLGLIALRCMDSSSTISGKLHDFYIQKLNLKKPSEAQIQKDLTYNEVLERVRSGAEGYNMGDGSSQEEWEGDEEIESEEEFSVGN